ncbi:DNA polymerase IV [Streptococcus oralis]|uniref:DNA polymerase IV n=1 Tax=Streptococcus oralis TaxID=1303 RepID=A0A139Q517_STROR|nr:DNA polymerase IV [Streptococcus oralis]AQA08217.1 impB/mucB/samB family protein [Streptococcus oralis]KXT97614.1 DNA polymerase IV [Streptococcus oralis]MBN6011624.1 DNA polymerase IV [Streptococcus oralis subsp. oralis]MBN6013354.1 DNA polymerase IV [Streptococcus oralis subsp. oralis]OJG02084.1 DNA polymerase IV [Streptococcus oralis]
MLIFPLINDLSRKIIHIDMDAFFAAVEIRDNPKLKGKPVIIGSDPRQTGGRGVVSTCSYEARAFGVHSAMSSKEAYERCPQAVFISGNYEKYKTVGLEIRAIFKRYTDLIEPMSIDEAYLDVTENKLGIKSAVKIARLIQQDIWQELHLTASAGVSYNKFLAKMASDYQKPHGLAVILPDQAQDFLKQMDIAKFHGVGKKTVERLHEMGIYTGADLLDVSEVTLIDRFGRLGYELYRKARGIHNSPVKPDRIRKSIGKEKTYGKILQVEEDIKKELSLLSEKVAHNLSKQDKAGKIIILKIRYADFSTLTRRKSLPQATQDVSQISQTALQLYEELADKEKGIRLLGITVTGF